MPNLTVSSDIDSFMQSANKAAAVSFLGALTTTQIAGLSTNAPAALATAPVVGLSTFASPADHQHVFPTAAQVGALGATASAGGDLVGNYPNPTLAAITTAQSNVGSSSVVPVISTDAKGRVTGLSTVAINALTTNQIAGLSTAAPAALATAPVVGLSTFAARADHQHSPLPAGTVYEFFEHFLSSTAPFLGNISTSNSGGTIGSSGAFAGRMGVVNFSTGATASADQRAAINNAPTALSVGGSNLDYYIAANFAQSSAGWFTGTSTGFFRAGLLSVVAQTGIAEPASGVYFRATNSQALEFVTRNSNVETSTSTGVSLANGTFNKYEILINAAATQVVAKIDGNTVATHTTNIPVVANRLGLIVTLQRVTADTNAYSVALDWLYFKATPSTPWV